MLTPNYGFCRLMNTITKDRADGMQKNKSGKKPWHCCDKDSIPILINGI